MSNPLSRLVLPGTAAFATVMALAPAGVASTQPASRDNPFAVDDLPGLINSTADIDVGGKPSFPNFPGLPDVTLPKTPEGAAREVLERTMPGGLPSGVSELFNNILDGNIGGILSSLFDIFSVENALFQDISNRVLGKSGLPRGEAPTNPYQVRLPNNAEDEKDAAGLLTRTPMVFRRDQANQYDQELSRAMAAPMLGDVGQAWMNEEIKLSAEMLKSGVTSAASVLNKSTGATAATSTQDIVRAAAEMSGLAANMQLQEMKQTAKIQQSLWQMQRLNSAQLQLTADLSEAADEANRRDRADRAAGLAGAAYSFMIVPGLGRRDSVTTTAPAPNPPKLFAQ